MKLIGILGSSGSGKTTFTEYLEKKPSVGVVHVDLITADIKKKYFKSFLQSKDKNTTENTIVSPKIKTGVRTLFYKNKFAFNLFINIRNKLIEKQMENQIREFKNKGKKLVIIEDWALPTHKKLCRRLDKIYAIKRNLITRRRALKERDNLSTREVKLDDIPYSLKYIQIPEKSDFSTIYNDGSIQDLYKKAEELYKSFEILTFDERYSVRGKENLKNPERKSEKSTKKKQKKQDNVLDQK